VEKECEMSCVVQQATAACRRKENEMKKIFDGKKYDTDTAECVHSWDNGRFGNDFRFRSKTLYHTPKGAWFLVHEGGPMTDMAVPCGSNSTSGSSSIEVVSEEDAFAFLCSHEGADQAEKYFPGKIQDA